MAEDTPVETYQSQVLCVELTQLFIPSASLLDIFCSYATNCACPPDTATTITTDETYPSDHDCTGSFTISPDSADGCDGYDPNVVPDWYLAKLETAWCSPLGLVVFPGYCLAVGCFRTHGPPTGPVFDPITNYCGNFWDIWQYVLLSWRNYGEKYLARHCGASGPPRDEPTTDVLSVQKTKVRFPAGTEVLGIRHVTMLLDEPCELCES